MAPIGTLWGVQIQRQTKVILAVAAVADLELETPAVEFKVTNKSPEYLAKFPMGKIPAFEGKDGLKLFEGAPIARYVASFTPESGLLGKDAGEAALVDQWVHFGESEIATFSYEALGLVTGYFGAYNKEMHDIILQRQACGIQFLDTYLAASASGYLVSDALTLADIVVASVTQQAAQVTCGAAERAQYPNVFAHYERVTAHPKVKDVFGEAGFVEEKRTYSPQTAA